MILTIAHTKGGVGKSTLAWHLAHAFRDSGKQVTLVDLDFQQTLYFLHAMGGKDIFTILQPKSVAELFSEALVKPHGENEVFIIDVGGFDSDINRAAIDMAHKVLIPISNSVTEVLGFKTFEAILQEANILGEKEIAVVLNNIHPATTNFDEIKQAIGDNYRVLNTVVRNRKVYKETMGIGGSVFSGLYPKAQEEIKGVMDEIRNGI